MDRETETKALIESLALEAPIATRPPRDKFNFTPAVRVRGEFYFILRQA